MSSNVYPSNTNLSFRNVTQSMVWRTFGVVSTVMHFSDLQFLLGQSVSWNIVNFGVWYPIVFSSMKSRISYNTFLLT
jgi:hypothetical protein